MHGVSAEELANSAFLNLSDLFRAMTRLKYGVLEEEPRFSRHLTFPTNPMFKGVWGTRLKDDEVESAIDDMIHWFKSRGAPYFFWWLDPEMTPTDLGARLAARGMLSMEGQQQELAAGIKQTAAGAPVMTMDFAGADAALVDAVPAGFVIEEVRDDAMLEDFKRVFVTTYEIPDWAGQAWVDATRAFGIGRSPWRMFVGYLDGEAVATNMLFNDTRGVASVYAVATVPKAQGKGIGAAITLKPLLMARDQGMRYASLFSSEMGFSVYRRIGFRDTGARINRYLWRSS